MHKLIEELKQHHADKSKVFSDLQRLINDLTDTEKVDATLDALGALIESFQSAADKAHHDNEELILAELQNTDAPIHRRVEEISGDHQAFSKVLARLSELIQKERDNPELVALQLGEFKKHYEEHASVEELIFFPIANEHLNERQWERIEAAWE